MLQVPTQSRLVLIGGGSIPETVTAEILRLAKGQNSRIVLCDWGSGNPGAGRAQGEKLFGARHGCPFIRILAEESPKRSPDVLREFANAESSLGILEECDVFFFSGGDQRILLHSLYETRLAQRLIDLWRQGRILIAGSSAGLQIHSELALTGIFQQHDPEDVTHEEIRCTRIALGNVSVRTGFGLLKDVILDQHFVRRQRQNRLISAILDYPSHVGIGVDEGTALVFEGASGTYVRPRVLGESCIFYVHAKQAGMQFEPEGQLRLVENLNCGLVWEGAPWPFSIRLA